MRDDEVQESADRPHAPSAAPLAPNRSLVFYERRRRGRSLVQAPADFVAQLIACEAGLEQFRRARRQEPSVGASRYREASAQAPGFERRV